MESFADIQRRLQARIEQTAARGRYVLIGHSLGGVLLRAALRDVPATTRLPQRLFLLGSPVVPSRLAERVRANPVYRALAGDCGDLLSSADRMQQLGRPAVPTTSIAGTRGLPWTRSAFDGQPNDGVVAVSEVHADWMADRIQIDTLHTLLPASRRVAEIILERVRAFDTRA